MAAERLGKDGHGNMEWLEFGLREALCKDAQKLLGALLNDPQLAVPNDRAMEGERCYRERAKTIQTLFGPVEVRRNYYHGDSGTGIPMVKKELEGNAGRQPDGSAKTREVKLGCIFTQHGTDEEGRPMRDHNSSSYVATMESSAEFGGILRREAKKQIAYFQKNRDRMLYATFRAAGYFIGSGVVKAGCRTVVGQRLKQSGMFWSSSGAQNVLAIRSALLSNRFDHYWDELNHPLPAAA